MNETMVKRHARLYKTPAYKRGDEVLVRYKRTGEEALLPNDALI